MTTPAASHLPRLTFILGGARSGKSRFAEALLNAHAGPKTYIATAEAWDQEMAERIDAHQARRGSEWTTLNAPLDLVEALAAAEARGVPVLIDCLTLWLTNVMLAERDVTAEIDGLAGALAEVRGPVVVVSNEVGLGIVPSTPLGRRFRDQQGTLNQRVAAVAADVVFVAAGLPLTLKAASVTPKAP